MRALPDSAGGQAARALLVRAGPPSVHALGFAAVGALALGLARVLPLDAPPLSLFTCPVRAATGLPCLSCGATHAFSCVMHGELARALASNPLFAALALLLALHCLVTSLRLCGLGWAPAAPHLDARAARSLRLGALAALALNWAFVALRGAP